MQETPPRLLIEEWLPAAARERHLASLAKREPDAWRQVDTLIATKRPGDYEKAVQLLKDLADLGEKRGRQAEVRDRLGRLRQEHVRKADTAQASQGGGAAGRTETAYGPAVQGSL